MMQTKPIILVTGATGGQGGSTVKALLSQNKFALRALTRDPDSPKSTALRQAGVEVVRGDMEDVESLKKAMKGVYGVFGVTSFWEHGDKEFRQGKNLVEAVSQSGIGHFVFSALDNYSQLSQGRIAVPHYDMKAALKTFTKKLGLKASFVHLSFYYENFLTWFLPQRRADGNFYFGFPQGEVKLASVSVADTGPVVAKIFDHPDEYIGRSVYLVGSDISGRDYAAVLSRVLGLNIFYNHVPREEFATYGFDGAAELGAMFEVQRLHVPERQLGLIESYGLNPAMQPFDQWVEKNKDQFLAALQAQVPQAV
jgi:uncharacterized protein YbjT (DUF2867 family)